MRGRPKHASPLVHPVDASVRMRSRSLLSCVADSRHALPHHTRACIRLLTCVCVHEHNSKTANTLVDETEFFCVCANAQPPLLFSVLLTKRANAPLRATSTQRSTRSRQRRAGAHVDARGRLHKVDGQLGVALAERVLRALAQRRQRVVHVRVAACMETRERISACVCACVHACACVRRGAPSLVGTHGQQQVAHERAVAQLPVRDRQRRRRQVLRARQRRREEEKEKMRMRRRRCVMMADAQPAAGSRQQQQGRRGARVRTTQAGSSPLSRSASACVYLHTAKHTHTHTHM